MPLGRGVPHIEDRANRDAASALKAAMTRLRAPPR